MTLKEKFFGVMGDVLPHWNKIDAEACEIIADDYALEFGKWLNNKVIEPNGTHHNLFGNLTVSQLLPIFKKEKGLI